MISLGVKEAEPPLIHGRPSRAPQSPRPLLDRSSREKVMKGCRMTGLAAGLAVAGCSSSPYQPINQLGPIRAMDRFFSGGAIDAYTPPAGVRPQRQPEVWARDPLPSVAQTATNR
jgi:hypothetical protein